MLGNGRRRRPCSKLALNAVPGRRFCSGDSAGEHLRWWQVGDRQDAAEFDWTQAQLASPALSGAKAYVEEAVPYAGCRLIDLSGLFVWSRTSVGGAGREPRFVRAIPHRQPDRSACSLDAVSC